MLTLDRSIRPTSARLATAALRAVALLACLWAIAPGEASAQACGNPGQRACCLFESSFGACVDGAAEIPGCPGDCLCGGFNPLGIRAQTSCAAVTPCGGADQRACCVGEQSFGACQDGLVEEPQANAGFCANTIVINSSGVCRATTPCGGENQRACCVGEGDACQAGLVQEPQSNAGQCSNQAWGIQSSGVCRAITPCGGENQRACCVGEGTTCQSGLAEVPQPNSGQCGNQAWGVQSSGVCKVVTPCGDDGQRACCVGERDFGACRSGNVAWPANTGEQCGNLAPGITSDSECEAVTACGGQGQRSCCIGEASFGPCQSGLTELPVENPFVRPQQCGNLLYSTYSLGTCGVVTPCGGQDQRACCVGESSFGACQDGYFQTGEPNTGQCGNQAVGIQSTGYCSIATPCGGDGQRSCCLGEADFGACQAGLVFFAEPSTGACANSITLGGTFYSNGRCRSVTPCGGSGQRACCLGESNFGACQSGLVEVAQANAGQCGNQAGGIQSSGTCVEITPCGGPGERACCVGEAAFGPCENGLVEVPQANAGQCGNLSPGIQSSGVCQGPNPCGGVGQRACCEGEAEFECQPGLVAEPQDDAGQCGNQALGTQSDAICRAVTPCGGAGERACCVGEAAFGACEEGLVAEPQPNAGQCGNQPFGVQADAVCAAPGFGPCSDATDDDGDGFAAYPEDPGCADALDSDERDASLVCDNGIDDDGDGVTDFPADAGCQDPRAPTETAACQNGIDDEGDGLTDLDDPACTAGPNGASETAACQNGIDDDGDGDVDLSDGGCDGENDASERGTLVCDDEIDADGDGATGFPQDPGCSGVSDGDERYSRFACDDGDDNDGDGLTDMADPGCPRPDAGIENPQCDDGIDNDGDGFTDADDSTCQPDWPYWESACGLGAELALLLPALAAWRRRASRRLPA